MGRPHLVLALVLSLILLGGTYCQTASQEVDVEGVVGETPPREQRQNAEKFEFQAEVSRLMDILINSLYSNKDIFLRELISNAADAMDKLRFLSLSDRSILGKGEQAKLEVKISLDNDKKVLKIRDRGIGMTKQELVSNLGTIAKSGTSAFLEQMQKGGDINLIGQFGVGFYSVFLVADYVEVITKNNDDKQYIWESDAGGNFAISEDPTGEQLGRGTQINIHLKEETQEYAEEGKLKELVTRYSEFIEFPIYLYSSKEVEVEAAEEEADEAAADEDVSDAEDVADEAEDEEETEEEPAKPAKKETVWEWELLNDAKPIWLRSPSDVSEEEYTKFYHAISKSTDTPMTYSHFKAEGDVEFRSLLFVPPTAPPGFLDNYYTNKAGLRLYVRRVFISDEYEDLMPRYLGFVKGVVDSDTLPLSVSRETLQQHASLKTIKKKLVRKALDMLRKLAEDDKPEEEAEGVTESDAAAGSSQKYDTFWGQYGKAIKLGVIEDGANRQRLARLLRFHTSKYPDTWTSLEDYVSRMQEDQKQIYYLAGDKEAELAKSPFLEQLLEKDLEVIFLTDAVDEYMMSNLPEYDEKKFQNAAKDDLKLGGKKGKKEKRVREAFKGLTAWWKGLLGAEAEQVKLSTRLATSPCIVSTSKYGYSANMERIMRAQALSDKGGQGGMGKGGKILEINPRHPLIQELRTRWKKDQEATETANLARLLWDTALLESGFLVEQPKDFNGRVFQLMKGALNIKGDLTALRDAPEEEPTTAKEQPMSEPPTEDLDLGVAPDQSSAKDEL
ncbi:hypothetical protein WJX74_002421 [Apatococcus lobatus]|uniref:Histidine kinase/HSP90-like ATPase domain-containing protein n=2 Tax=Apatococcus TaxID=904362 RepID=A0AAW1T652_9CHLO